MDCRYKVTCSERDLIVELSSYKRFEGTGLMPGKKVPTSFKICRTFLRAGTRPAPAIVETTIGIVTV